MATLKDAIGNGIEAMLEAISQSEEPVSEMVMNMDMTVNHNEHVDVKFHYHDDKIDVTVTKDGEEIISSSMAVPPEVL